MADGFNALERGLDALAILVVESGMLQQCASGLLYLPKEGALSSDGSNAKGDADDANKDAD